MVRIIYQPFDAANLRRICLLTPDHVLLNEGTTAIRVRLLDVRDRLFDSDAESAIYRTISGHSDRSSSYLRRGKVEMELSAHILKVISLQTSRSPSIRRSL